MTKEQLQTEILELRREETELRPQVEKLRQELQPLVDRLAWCINRRFDLERKVVEVKKLPYHGPERFQRRKAKSEQQQLLEAVQKLKGMDRQFLIDLLDDDDD